MMLKMKRKYIGLIVFAIIISCLFVGNISAEKYSCIYRGEDIDPNGVGDLENDSGEEYIEMVVNTEDKTIEFIPSEGLNITWGSDNNWYMKEDYYILFVDEFLINGFKASDYIKQFDGKCPLQITPIILRRTLNWQMDESILGVLINDGLIYSNSKIKSGDDMDKKYDANYFDYNYCIDKKFSDSDAYPCFNENYMATWLNQTSGEPKSDKPSIKLVNSCSVYIKYFGKDYSTLKYITEGDKKYIELDNSKNKEIDTVTDESQYDNYGLYYLYSYYNENCKKNNKNSKCKKVMTSFNINKTILSNFCKNVINNRDAYSTCMTDCLNLNDTLYKLTREDKSGACHLSDQIIAFIYNILKWIKYIAPVLVIILGILDFVKALAAQDDDAMKKAQSKFIKRLISAVLLFLLPLIIDYILSVFHIYNGSCDITTIFD